MNTMQKTCAIIGSTAFIVWLVLAIQNTSFTHVASWGFDYKIKVFIVASIYNVWGYVVGHSATLIQTTTFITWVVSLIAFNIYKD